MGRYINKGNDGFLSALNGEYVDKTGLISVVNRTLNTERRYSCVTRCRRFGKSMAANMLGAYYDKSCDSKALFAGLEITGDSSFERYLNAFPVIKVDITDFTTKYYGDKNIVKHIQEAIKDELLNVYPDVVCDEGDDLMDVLTNIVASTKEKFIFIIDEWDAICREFDSASGVMDDYVNLLRRLFKGGSSSDVFAGAYMTGILPIKRYNTQSALNNFREYSVVMPGKMDRFFGFVPSEVERLAEKGDVSVDELRDWYDGYHIGKEPSVYNPYSVIEAISRGFCESFWSSTSAYDSISTYVGMNYEGLKNDIIYMLSGGHCDVDTTGFENDPAMVKTKDDVLTVLIHLGYLAYDWDNKQCYIPNKEVALQMEKAVKACGWLHLNTAIDASKRLLADTLDMNEAAVAQGLDRVHDDNTSILSYNNENSLACVISIAYYYAKTAYIFHRELATGKGFADIVMIPRGGSKYAALVIELKCDKSTDAAIDQIHRKHYPAKVAEYTGDILLVGINYDKKTKAHTCKIERVKL